MSIPSDHELTVMVDAAVQSVEAKIKSGALQPWQVEDFTHGRRNEHREAAFAHIYPAVKLLPELGWVKPRVITTVEERDALPYMTVIREDGVDGSVFEMWRSGWQMVGVYAKPGGPVTPRLPVIVLFVPEPQP